VVGRDIKGGWRTGSTSRAASFAGCDATGSEPLPGWPPETADPVAYYSTACRRAGETLLNRPKESIPPMTECSRRQLAVPLFT